LIIKNGEVVKGDRLDNVNSENAKVAIRIDSAKFDLINQNKQRITNESYKGKVYVLEFSSRLVLLFVQNESKHVANRKKFFVILILELYLYD
jgi:hypothetical protein